MVNPHFPIEQRDGFLVTSYQVDALRRERRVTVWCGTCVNTDVRPLAGEPLVEFIHHDEMGIGQAQAVTDAVTRHHTGHVHTGQVPEETVELGAGLELPALSEGWIPLDVFALYRCLDEDGDVAWAYRHTDGLSAMEAVGMCEYARQGLITGLLGTSRE